MHFRPPVLSAACLAILASAGGARLPAGERGEVLRAALKGADRIVVADVELGRQGDPKQPFVIGDAAKIAVLFSRLEFDDRESGFYCACRGERLGSGNVRDLCALVEQAGGVDNFDRAALAVARSLSGERGLLDKSVFELESYTEGFGALAALEREGDKAALDAVILGGTTHSWAAIREESVLTVERMTGRTWFKNQKHERAEWHGRAIREWWQANRDSYAPGVTGKNRKPQQGAR